MSLGKKLMSTLMISSFLIGSAVAGPLTLHLEGEVSNLYMKNEKGELESDFIFVSIDKKVKKGILIKSSEKFTEKLQSEEIIELGSDGVATIESKGEQLYRVEYQEDKKGIVMNRNLTKAFYDRMEEIATGNVGWKLAGHDETKCSVSQIVDLECKTKFKLIFNVTDDFLK
jgi:hypothetical protein